MTRHLATCLLSCVVCLLAAPVAAAERCDDVIFSCRLGGSDPDRVTNLKQLRSWRRSDSWISRNCKVESQDPAGCSWRGYGAGSASGGGGGTTVLVATPSYAPPAADSEPNSGPAAVPAAPAKRDDWGKRMPTPPPPRETASVAVAGPDTGAYAAEIAAAAARYRLPAAFIRAVMMVESGANPSVVSNKGAVGLMQLLPVTAQHFGVEDIYDPAQNIMGGARFLRGLANKFQGDLVKVLSAYHAGAMRVTSRDATPFAATDSYVRKVLKTYYQLRDASLREGPSIAR